MTHIMKERLLKTGNNRSLIATAAEARALRRIPEQLTSALRDPGLEAWFQTEAKTRLGDVPPEVPFEDRRSILEAPNRLPSGSVKPIDLHKLFRMDSFAPSAGDILDRARHGTTLLCSNQQSRELGTAARGIPAGGASTRAEKWAASHAETAARFGFTPETPRFLYRAGGRTLIQNTIRFSSLTGRAVNKVFPNIIMTNVEIVGALMRSVSMEWGNYTQAELDNTFFFNQISVPRIWVDDGQMIADKLFPAGHGDYPLLAARYGIFKALASCGIKYLFFSNADEWMWQPEPVMVSVAQELFDKGFHMVGISVENKLHLIGGGPMERKDGKQILLELNRAPKEMANSTTPPKAVNTTFYVLDVPYAAEMDAGFLNVPKVLVVKNVPGRDPGSTEQILGLDSSCGDVFSEVLNTAFIKWPFLNFLGIKDGSTITDFSHRKELGGRSSFEFLSESAATYVPIVEALCRGERWAADFLYRTGYSYMEPEVRISR